MWCLGVDRLGSEVTRCVTDCCFWVLAAQGVGCRVLGLVSELRP